VRLNSSYTELSKIDVIAGKSWRDSCFTTIEWPEGFALLVFTNNNRAVGCIEHPRDTGDFASLQSYEAGFSVQGPLFMLDDRGKMVWMGNR
jgi:hypothetical protein